MLATTLFACSSDDEEEIDPVAELTEIDELFEPEVMWSMSTDGVEHYFSRLQPAIAKDKVFVSGRTGDAYALDIATGDELWSADLSDIHGELGFFDDPIPARISGGASVGYGMVVWGSENGDVFALDMETGELVWQVQVAGEVISKPAFDSNLVIVNTAAGALVALDRDTGEQRWKVEQAVPPLSLRGVSGVATSSGGAFIGSAAGEVVVVVIENGQQGWTADIGEPSGATELERIVDVDVTPVIFGDKIYAISSNGNLAAIELRSGRVLWKRSYSSYRQLTISGNRIFATDIQGHVYAINRNSGMELWSNLLLTNRGTTGVAATDDYAVVGDFEGYLHWIDKTSGEIVARHQIDDSGIYVTPIVHENLIYAQTRDGELEVIATPDIIAVEESKD